MTEALKVIRVFIFLISACTIVRNFCLRKRGVTCLTMLRRDY